MDTHTFGSFTLEEFRETLRRECSQHKSFMIASYSRKALNQTGDGHFSPVGGYFEEKDLVLLLDVARFKYPPHWVKTAVLFDAMSRPDADTGRPRGYVTLSKPPALPSILVACSRRFEDWRCVMEVMCGLMDCVHKAMGEAGDLNAADCLPRPLHALLDKMPLDKIMMFLELRQASGCFARSSAWREQREELLSEIHQLKIYKLVDAYLQCKAAEDVHLEGCLYASERLTIILLIGSMYSSNTQVHGWESPLMDMSPAGQQLLTWELVFVINQLSTLCSTFKVKEPMHHLSDGSGRKECSCRQSIPPFPPPSSGVDDYLL